MNSAFKVVMKVKKMISSFLTCISIFMGLRTTDVKRNSCIRNDSILLFN